MRIAQHRGTLYAWAACAMSHKLNTQASIPILVPRNRRFFGHFVLKRGVGYNKPNCSKDENGAFPSPRRGQARIGSSGEGRSRECAKFLPLRSLEKMKQFPTFPKRVTTLTRYPGMVSARALGLWHALAKRIARPPPSPTRGREWLARGCHEKLYCLC